MARNVITGLYEFDPIAANPDNLIPAEKHAVYSPERDDFHYIIPLAAPFFVDSMVVTNDSTGVVLEEGRDYVLGHWFVEAMESTGRPIAGSIRFLHHDLEGVFSLHYHTLGGDWGFDDATILAELANRQYNPLIRSWGQVAALPYSFPPTPHDQRLDTLIGSAELLEKFQELADAVVASSEGSDAAHVSDFNNPHRVTKAQVGLGLVENFPPSTREQAEEGIHNASVMTPLQTRRAIQEIALTLLQAHLEDTNNPHGVSKEDVGLSLVRNFGIASVEDAREGVRNDLYLTPLSGKALIEESSDSGRIDGLEQALINHQQDFSNPHRVQAEQTGAYTKEEVDLLMASVTATDTPRFDGLTGDEWRSTLPSFDDVTELVTTLQDEYVEATVGISGVELEEVQLPQLTTPTGIYAGWGGLGLYIADGSMYSVPSFPGEARPITEYGGVLILPNAQYRIDEDGTIHSQGSAAFTVPSNLTPGSEPDPAAIAINGTPDIVYVTLEDGSLTALTASGPETVNISPVEDLAISWDGENRVLVRLMDGSLQALGESSWVSLVTPVLNSHSNIVDFAVGRDVFILLDGDGNTTAYSIGSTIEPITLESEYQTGVVEVSGSYDHFVFLKGEVVEVGEGDENLGEVTEISQVLTWGDNDDFQRDLPDELPNLITAVAGRGYTATLQEGGLFRYWGNAPDNRFILPSEFEPILTDPEPEE